MIYTHDDALITVQTMNAPSFSDMYSVYVCISQDDDSIVVTNAQELDWLIDTLTKMRQVFQ